MYKLPHLDPDTPVIAAYGAGLDSTAMIIEWVSLGYRLDAVLFADTGGEKPETYAFLVFFKAWLAERGIPLYVVRYTPKNFKNFPAYSTLEENVLTNGTLPSIVFGRGTCSLKWKVAPQHSWAKQWAPAIETWARGVHVIKLIGYDCSPADNKRYKNAATIDDPHYLNVYPLRAWGWTRVICDARIRAEGIIPPPKSACWFCSSQRPEELDQLPPVFLRRIVLMEARAKPRLRNVDGLWRSAVKGTRGATPHPGSMTEYIRQKGLLPSDEIDAIIALAPADLLAFQATVDPTAATRPAMSQWITLFDATRTPAFRSGGTPALYASTVSQPSEARA